MNAFTDYYEYMPACANCGADYEAPVYRTSLCAACGRELKTCTNCDHYLPGAANDCREPVSELIVEKNRANFCDWFRPSSRTGTASKRANEQGRQAFADLFNDD